MRLNRYSVRKSGRRWVVYRNSVTSLDWATSFSKAILRAQEHAAKDPVADCRDRNYREMVSGPLRRAALAQVQVGEGGAS